MDYIKALEEERKKMLMFEKELPLSLHVVTQAIESYKKQQIIEETVPVLEEFLPLRPSCSSSDEENHDAKIDNVDDKPNWLKSVQLWNQQPEPQKEVVKKPIGMNVKKIGGAFHPFEREKAVVNEAPASSANENKDNDNNNGGGGCGKEKEKEKEGSLSRKARRCWSPELHRRFLHALQQLGGAHVATPKQIRELMKVDGLTNDEVKSHLQKYRLHNRKTTNPTGQNSSTSTSTSPQQLQIVLVGGNWVAPPEYPAAAHSNKLYAPVACLPSQPKNSERSCDENANIDNGERTNSHSPASSTSSETTTASPPLSL